jgi:DNA (cytosine-5)-methyltransferase 1
MPSFYEFFAGGGMARAGLGKGWECLFANDIDAKKGASYRANWGGERLRIADVGALTPKDLPWRADLAWASFPCQDLSLAGDYIGLKGERSGTFWLFWRVMRALADEKRAPSLVVLENVCGALTSHEGKDFAMIGTALEEGGYRFGALVMDAARFVPQSRPRLFIVAVHEGQPISEALTRDEPHAIWHPANLTNAYDRLSERSKTFWVWWDLPVPPPRRAKFGDIVEDEPRGVEWHSPEGTRKLLAMMSPLNRKKVEHAQRMGKRMVGTVYKRTRMDEEGKRAQRAEIRFDDVAGCLRTPVGGSSRQSVMVVDGDGVRSRLLAPREAARLMGLPDSYRLPENYNEAYHLAGDGVVVPVVRFLAGHLLEPLLVGGAEREEEAA